MMITQHWAAQYWTTMRGEREKDSRGRTAAYLQRRVRKTGERREGSVQVDQLELDRGALSDRGLLPGHPNEQRHVGGQLRVRLLAPLVQLAELVACRENNTPNPTPPKEDIAAPGTPKKKRGKK